MSLDYQLISRRVVIHLSAYGPSRSWKKADEGNMHGTCPMVGYVVTAGVSHSALQRRDVLNRVCKFTERWRRNTLRVPANGVCCWRVPFTATKSMDSVHRTPIKDQNLRKNTFLQPVVSTHMTRCRRTITHSVDATTVEPPTDTLNSSRRTGGCIERKSMYQRNRVAAAHSMRAFLPVWLRQIMVHGRDCNPDHPK